VNVIKKYHCYVLSQYLIKLKINTIIIKNYFQIEIQYKVEILLFHLMKEDLK